MDKVLHYLEKVDKELAKYPVFVSIDKQTGVPKAKSYAVVGAFGLYLLLIIFNCAGSLLTNLLGFLYPAYASFKAVESSKKEDDTQWLTYWCVFGFLNTLEYFSDILLYWLPFYYLIKAGLIVYMILPQFRGAEFMYLHFFRPVLLQHTGSGSTSPTATSFKKKGSVSVEKSD